MNKVWAVTDGYYSEYRVVAIFDSEEKAETYRDWYCHDTVEQFEFNPEHPAEPTGRDHYQIRYLVEEDKISVKRRSNEREAEGDWELSYSNNFVTCTAYAADEKGALKVASEKVAALKAGSTHAYGSRGERQKFLLPSGAPSNVYKTVYYNTTCVLNGKKFVEIAKELCR